MIFVRVILLLFNIIVCCFVEAFPIVSYDEQRIKKTSVKLDHHPEERVTHHRRTFLGLVQTSSLIALLGRPTITNAGIDLSKLQELRMEETTNLPGGVSYREFRTGKDDDTSVQIGSRVAVEMTIRCISFKTPDEPTGMKYYATQEDTTFNELAWTIGSKVVPAGLEEAIIGMHRNGIRYIEIPSSQIYIAKNANQLPLPESVSGKRVFNRIFQSGRSFQTDATFLFEVLVTRIK